jgi:hypothetical protein
MHTDVAEVERYGKAVSDFQTFLKGAVCSGPEASSEMENGRFARATRGERASKSSPPPSIGREWQHDQEGLHLRVRQLPSVSKVATRGRADDILSDIIRARVLHRFDTTSTLVGGWGHNSKRNISNKIKTSKCCEMDIIGLPRLAMKIRADTETYFAILFQLCVACADKI